MEQKDTGTLIREKNAKLQRFYFNQAVIQPASCVTLLLLRKAAISIPATSVCSFGSAVSGKCMDTVQPFAVFIWRLLCTDGRLFISLSRYMVLHLL